MIPINSSIVAAPFAQGAVTEEDMKQIASTIRADLAPEFVNVACTQLLCSHLLERYSQQHGQSVNTMVGTLARMVDAYAQDRGYSALDLRDAQATIERAGQSLAYISAIPSDAAIEAAVSQA